ncbi:heme exporter protein CcmB [Aestuariirhabdus litorea]|uniref:Heme exporter protein B n=1 Tax=Aestuariirhabdus litorea TaxID=2528527 RepID=A0A3P3VNS8_9GAMM|nr:heme exporter protein CcmB [Aestuariirhabdus litorea]RRJ84411.1 heme exporter protein CcmB [Aestuariirhabdus litorea]RWW97635.1 heme exporter protein CcmB [Endozoicomonadaceae bacterium GTF-13]
MEINSKPSLWQSCVMVLKRDLRLALRNQSDLVNPLIFFVMVATLFPLGVTPDKEFLSQIATGIIWVAALLATLLSLDAMFRSDYDDGSLEQLLLSPYPLYLLVLAKVTSHWIVSGLLLTLLFPLLAIVLFLPWEGYPAMLASLLLGTPLLSLIGAIGAALTVGLKKGGVLLSLLILPLYIPVLIFGTGAVGAAINGTPYIGHLLWLGVFLVMAITLAPFAIAAALRVSIAG